MVKFHDTSTSMKFRDNLTEGPIHQVTTTQTTSLGVGFGSGPYREETLSHELKISIMIMIFIKTFSYHKTRIFHFISKNLRPGI